MKFVSVSIILFASATALYGQSGIKDLFFAESEVAINDSHKLVRGYIGPMMKSFSMGMANGWYNTAKPHKPLGFDITATVNGVYIPQKEEFYNIEALHLQRVELVSVNENVDAISVPTVLGPDADVVYRYNQSDFESREFSGPSGLGLEDKSILGNMLPVPMAQVGVGIAGNTDLKVRFIPAIERNDYSFRFYGLGIMHDVKQYIPGVKVLPFDLSLFAGYTALSFELDLAEGPSTEGQKATFNARAFTFQGLLSKKLAMLTLYAGYGYSKANAELNMLGSYDFDEDGEVDLKDPVSDMDFPTSGTRTTLGARFQLLVFTFHADYTMQEYNVLTIGVGLSLR